MTIHAIALTGLSNTAKSFRNEMSALMPFATAARPTGTRSGVRVGTPTSTVSLSGLTGTVKCHSGVMDIQASVTAGPYVYAVTADETFAVTPAHATFARIDVVSIRINDTVEDGSGLETAQVVYTQGTAASTPLQPALTTTRELIIATIASPVSGGGAPVVSWVAPYTVAAGGILPVRNITERAALATVYPPTTHSPLYIWQIDIGRFLTTVDGVNWKDGSGRFIWADAAARTAATGMVAGDEGYQVDTGVTYKRVGSAWVNQDEYTAWTPVASVGSGALTAYTALGRRRQYGKTVHATYKLTLTNVGTAGGFLVVDLPVAAQADVMFTGSGYETAAAGFPLVVRPVGGGNTTQLFINRYDGSITGIFTSGAVFIFDVIYEAAA